MTLSIGFIGFGEAGSTIAAGLKSAGVESLAAFDIQTDAPGAGPLIRRRASESGTRLVASSEDLAKSSAILFSTVTSSSALDAARQTAPFLQPHHLYADLNSVSPALKGQLAAVVTATGAAFVEAAVMAPVKPYGHRVPMLLGGAGARRFADTLGPLGMRLDVLTDQVGTAAAVKMCRSIVVKGLEALLVECVLGASRYGAEQHVFASLNESYPGLDWKALADYVAGRTIVHGERRAREMEEVAETLRAIGIEPMMAEATARRQQWCGRLNLQARFGPDGPATYSELIAAIEEAQARAGR
jgi:3-hydroxyisobutyrate dehydrogenase-like beta-hydroxyacid dehydrogenase